LLCRGSVEVPGFHPSRDSRVVVKALGIQFVPSKEEEFLLKHPSHLAQKVTQEGVELWPRHIQRRAAGAMGSHCELWHAHAPRAMARHVPLGLPWVLHIHAAKNVSHTVGMHTQQIKSSTHLSGGMK
jgi:hypothetical protein